MIRADANCERIQKRRWQPAHAHAVQDDDADADRGRSRPTAPSIDMPEGRPQEHPTPQRQHVAEADQIRPTARNQRSKLSKQFSYLIFGRMEAGRVRR